MYSFNLSETSSESSAYQEISSISKFWNSRSFLCVQILSLCYLLLMVQAWWLRFLMTIALEFWAVSALLKRDFYLFQIPHHVLIMNICCLKPIWRKVEHLWGITKLQIHCFYLNDLLVYLNNAVWEAGATYFANLIAKSKGIISAITTPAAPSVPISNILWQGLINVLFFCFMIVSNGRNNIAPPYSVLPSLPAVQPVNLRPFSQFLVWVN